MHNKAAYKVRHMDIAPIAYAKAFDPVIAVHTRRRRPSEEEL